MEEAKKLRPEVEAKYTLKQGFGVGPVNFKGRVVDLDQLTVAEVEKLEAEGLGLFNRKPDPKPAKEK